MPFSKTEYKARQRRISDNNRRVNAKARFQNIKDELRAKERRERRQRREEENSDSSESDSDTDSATEEHVKTDSSFILFWFLVFIIVCNLLFWLYFVYSRVYEDGDEEDLNDQEFREAYELYIESGKEGFQNKVKDIDAECTHSGGETEGSDYDAKSDEEVIKKG